MEHDTRTSDRHYLAVVAAEARHLARQSQATRRTRSQRSGDADSHTWRRGSASDNSSIDKGSR